MNTLVGFIPFATFAILAHWIALPLALASAAVVSLLTLLVDAVQRKRMKILEIASAFLFGTLAAYGFTQSVDWSVIQVRLVVDIGLLAIMVASLVLHHPFTLGYAQDRVPAALWKSPGFYRVNMVISRAWCAAMLVVVIADVVMASTPGMPHGLSIAATVIALMYAAKYSARAAAGQASVA